MEYRNLGNSGLKVSVIGLGANSLGGRADKSTSIRIIHAALDAGVTLIDTANGYTGGKSEAIIGEALKDRRNQAVVATKAGLPQGEGPYNRGTSRRHLTQQLNQSLSRLGTDYVDLFYVHTFDEETPLEETLRTLDDFVRQGKVRYIAASNYRAYELATAVGIQQAKGWEPFVGLQPSYSLLDRTPERELIPLALQVGIGLVAYYPIAGGILTGKYRGGQVPSGSRMEKQPGFSDRLTPRIRQAADQFHDLAQEAGVDPAALAIRWLIDRPAVSSAIVGASRPEQVQANLKALDVHIGPDLRQRLDELSAPFVEGDPFGWYRLR
ncbi:aldo/keto reductase [Sulfobacillus harzensis]|uniref:Aldo/keto reductase n=1 Tax=Sulfobacillus harzensis TaxID=2729629 RepID=A0A7Y0L7V4_9FIRM|nr:aldo/keto reductase [Sulfobacillus harzensis]NMP23529.1 aldo/keto reductase [Sulfobacillus harzensis]